MCVRIEVHSVGQILTPNTVAGCLIHLLRPQARAQDDNVLGVLSNHRDHCLVVWLDGARPTLVYRFVVELEEHIGIATILASHLFEESLCQFHVLLSLMVVCQSITT